MTSSLVGSEMCIRDSVYTVPAVPEFGTPTQFVYQTPGDVPRRAEHQFASKLHHHLDHLKEA
eukprot:5824651-Prorocentrum_lima.AAC.1